MKSILLQCWMSITLIMSLNSAQAQEKIIRENGVGVSIFSEHLALPFESRLGEQSHYGSTIFYETRKAREGAYQFSHVFAAGYFHHNEFFRAYTISYKPTPSLKFGNTFQIDLPLGIGYGHSFSTKQGYKLEDGIYQKEDSSGKSHVLPSLGTGIRLNLDPIVELPVELLFAYEVNSLLPYSPNGSLPFTIHTISNFGIKYQLQ